MLDGLNRVANLAGRGTSVSTISWKGDISRAKSDIGLYGREGQGCRFQKGGILDRKGDKIVPEAEVRVRPHAHNIGQEARTLPPKPGAIVSHHRAFTPTSSVLFLCFRWMISVRQVETA